jgi:thiol:disulfide interchange protein DsbC
MSHLNLKMQLLLLVWLPLQLSHAGEQRWYSDQLAQLGQQLFTQNCASCHGANAESTPDWRKKGPDGKYPPPPLNGSAHAWHHPLDMLRGTVREGGARIGGTMPPFKEKFSATEIDAVIAFFQSKWSDDIYGRWQQRQSSSGLQRISNEEKPKGSKKSNDITRYLKGRIKGVDIGAPVLTPVPGIYQVRVGGEYVYVTRDGRFGFDGSLIDLEKGLNLREQAHAIDRLNILRGIPESDMVVYSAEGATKAALTVFTDTSCPYCRKLHKEVPKLQKAGVKVRYLPFPRNGKGGEGYSGLRSVWCAKDRRKAMDVAKGESWGVLGDGDCDAAKIVDVGYQIGIEVGVKGTPALMFPDGSKVDGYMPADKILSVLGPKMKSEEK